MFYGKKATGGLLGCIFLPKGMNKGGLNPEPRGAGWHRRANCPPKHQGLAGRLRFLRAFSSFLEEAHHASGQKRIHQVRR